VSVRLKLRLRLSSGKERPMAGFQWTYTVRNCPSLERDAVPLIAIWPDFRIGTVAWKTYYTFQTVGNQDHELGVRPWPAQVKGGSRGRTLALSLTLEPGA